MVTQVIPEDVCSTFTTAETLLPSHVLDFEIDVISKLPKGLFSLKTFYKDFWYPYATSFFDGVDVIDPGRVSLAYRAMSYQVLNTLTCGAYKELIEWHTRYPFNTRYLPGNKSSRPTGKTAIKALVRRGILDAISMGRGERYQVSAVALAALATRNIEGRQA